MHSYITIYWYNTSQSDNLTYEEFITECIMIFFGLKIYIF